MSASVDTPPSVPNEPEYDVGALNIYPKSGPTGQWNAAKQRKDWRRQIQPGENPSSFIVFSYYDRTTGAFHASELGMTFADADAVNLAPSGMTEPIGSTDPYWMLPTMPSPARPLAPGESIRGSPFGAIVVNANYVVPAEPETAQQSTNDQALQQILAQLVGIKSGVNELLAIAGKPSIP